VFFKNRCKVYPEKIKKRPNNELFPQGECCVKIRKREPLLN